MILKFRNRGAKVKELQKLLDIPTDGVFGPNTLKAVKAFQLKNGLTPDGIVGPDTWELLLEPKETSIKPAFKRRWFYNPFKLSVSDPEEKMVVNLAESETDKTNPKISSLINVINSSKIRRKVNKVVFHCTATSQRATVSAIMKYWRETLKWRSPGYHIIVKADGSWTYLLDFNKISNGVKGMNSRIINISYIGGIDANGKAKDNRTKAQRQTLYTIYRAFKKKMPQLTYHGHNEFSNKACPSFDVGEWLDSI